jgi:hypothetical protein
MGIARTPSLVTIDNVACIEFGRTFVVSKPGKCPECGKEYPEQTSTFFFYGPGEKMPK